MKVFKKEDFDLKVSDHYPNTIKFFLNQLSKIKKSKKIVLLGYGENMKWLTRILHEKNRNFIISDFRTEFKNYECGKSKVADIQKIRLSKNSVLLICNDEICEIKKTMKFIHLNKKLKNLDVIYYSDLPNLPFLQIQELKEIFLNSKNLANSMISDDQLFDLIQYVRATKNVQGDIVEFGCFNGGSSAFIVNSSMKYSRHKKIYLFDTFSGIPKAYLGLDKFWSGTFANNSYSEVKKKFSNFSNVNIVKGDIMKKINLLKSKKISFCYLASDTLESGEKILNFIWSKLSVNGIICVCDYGSYPNCLPLTYYCDEFVSNKKNCSFFYTPRKGMYIQKIQ
jgi:hypothetical protein